MIETLEVLARQVAYDTDMHFGPCVSRESAIWCYENARRLIAALGAQEPTFWTFRVNDAYQDISAHEPPDDAYDEGSLIPLYAAPQLPTSAESLRNMLRAMQSGEMTVSRGVELLDMWLVENYSDDQLPPVRNELGEDEMPWDRIDALVTYNATRTDEMLAATRRIATLESQLQQREGWQLVPKEPTQEMINASWDMAGVARVSDGQPRIISIAYQAMLAAAPRGPA